MSILLQLLLALLFVVPALCIAGYYLGLVFLRLLGARADVAQSDLPSHAFAIVIPAHNEEANIRRSIESCLALDYPREKYTVVVVADNCTDATANVARAAGAVCLERTEPKHRGKGHALGWAFERLADGPHDALLVLDADCRIAPTALRVFDRCLAEGSHVLQCNNVTSDYDQAAPSYVARVGQYLEYDFGYAPKSCLGLAVPLVGTGMVFHRGILEKHPWTATSVVEDVEYTLLLAKHGIPVRFVANVAVEKQPERRFDQIKVQRRRWARGTLQFSRREGLCLFLAGLATCRLRIADLGWMLLTMSRPLILLHLAATTALAAGLAATLHNGFAWSLLALALAAGAAQAGYYAIGILGLGLTGPRVRLLAGAPLVTLRLAWIALRSLLDFGTPTWDRTPRTAEILMVPATTDPASAER